MPYRLKPAEVLQETNMICEYMTEILINSQGNFLWINVDGICALRVNIPKGSVIKIEDDRDFIAKNNILGHEPREPKTPVYRRRR